jgi:hypothetical protein
MLKDARIDEDRRNPDRIEGGNRGKINRGLRQNNERSSRGGIDSAVSDQGNGALVLALRGTWVQPLVQLWKNGEGKGEPERAEESDGYPGVPGRNLPVRWRGIAHRDRTLLPNLVEQQLYLHGREARVQLLTIKWPLDHTQRAKRPDYEPDLNFKKAKEETPDGQRVFELPSQ